MTGERARGAILYSTAGALVAAGATWWFLAAPPESPGDPAAQWRSDVERQLPDVDGQADAQTAALPAGGQQTFESFVDTGSYLVSLICRGGPDSFVRVSLSRTGNDSGLGVRCSGQLPPDSFEVGLGGVMRMTVVVGDEGPVVFRYSLKRVPG
ncbi:hypothetical protein Aab01nite_60280 [Paractinoplanes abujensis]|uniref:Uncharacterized protein n=1 Tax=Paractinoplanes abujensis TaxID=882441 RepID=A0A7W7G502_9ACTN|nr:DUF6023 family protein [Actinoplanes abujensis]MBB4696442.1 hypothetical protein [Actinoplanes abujensis]GID22438.1 hypothetical protein Aab01nite_60280 [Actinoplanes abujensis]